MIQDVTEWRPGSRSMRRVTAGFALLLGLLAATALRAAPDLIVTGGPVVTLDDDDRVVDAIAVEGGRIVALGSESEVLRLAGAATRRVDLRGHALLPGFVDSHSHANFIGLQAMSANLLPAPDGEGNSVSVLTRLLRDYIASEPPLLDELGWVIGFGYDDSQLAERRHPTRDDLDAVAGDLPVLIIHQSGHLGVANSRALELAGIDADTPDPDGGSFRRDARGRLTGVAEEYAFFRLMFAALAGADDALEERMVVAGTQLMARYGYTTAQEGRASPESLEAMERVAARGDLAIDLVAYADILTIEDVAPTLSYRDRYRVGGVKLTIDGSPQGKTAWLTEPYHVPPEGKDANYRGYSAVDVATVNAAVLRAAEHGWQILVHANGDAAIDAMIDAVRLARERHPGTDGVLPGRESFAEGLSRPVLIHGQTLRADQVPALRELGIFPSLFPMHTFYWGDWHRDSVLGPRSAENISPTGWIREAGMIFGSHHDAPVALPDSMRVLSSTVTRRTRSGDILGPLQRVDVPTALRAMTLWPAWQHFEEKDKGSLEVGKLADFVILSANPLTTDPGKLADIEVLATIKEGRAVYSAEPLAGQ